MTQVKFTKMQGAGNDFILMEYNEYKKIEDKFPQIAIKLCDRHFGIGADGIFVPVIFSTFSTAEASEFERSSTITAS